jgi:Ca2+-binding RTX toxin-like protein
MRMKTANKGILAPDLFDTADLLASDITIFGTTAVQVIGTAQVPGQLTYGGSVRDSVLGTGSVVGLYIEGTEQADTLYGTDRADDIYGLGGDDSLYGGAGNDTLYGGDGSDMLHGGAGADRLIGGGWGRDTASYTGSAAVTVNLALGGAGGDAEGDTYEGIDGVIGSSFNDTIIGTFGSNTLDGGDGNDTLIGGGGWGSDKLFGGAGNDTLITTEGDDVLTGGAGNDTLTSGTGWDMFVFAPGSGHDQITDFEHGRDKIDLRAYGPGVFGWDGAVAWGRIVDGHLVNPRALTEGDRVFLDVETNTLYECEFIPGSVPIADGGTDYTLVLGSAIATIQSANVHPFVTSDFLVA